MTEKILARIVADANSPELIEILAERLSPTDLQSLLLEVFRRRAERLTPQDVLRQYERNRFVRPAQASPQTLVALDQRAYTLLPAGFEVLELSPVCPLGTNSAMATVHQNRVVATIRNTEVCADATNVLALECAWRRRRQSRDQAPAGKPVRLCASQRVLRAQTFKGPSSWPHFRILNLCTAGRDVGSYRFETDALQEHITFYLRLLANLRQTGYRLQAVQVLLSAFDERYAGALQTHVLEPLAAQDESVHVALAPERAHGRGYYGEIAFEIRATDTEGNNYSLADGGLTDWTQQLLSDCKERLLISGIGSERLVLCFA